jgi:hypothetical protein
MSRIDDIYINSYRAYSSEVCSMGKNWLTKRIKEHRLFALDSGDSAAPTASIFPWPSPPGQAGFEFFLLPNFVHASPSADYAKPQAETDSNIITKDWRKHETDKSTR